MGEHSAAVHRPGGRRGGGRSGTGRPVRRAVLLAVATASVLISSGCGAQGQPPDGPSVPATATDSVASLRGGPSEVPQGAWWDWAQAEPDASNPVMDTTGEFCDRNQPDDVWFLAGTFGGTARRHCVVPAGRPLVAPVVNNYCDAETCAGFMAFADGTVILDGEPVPIERIEGEPIGSPTASGEPSAVACGLWIRVDPLPPGKHELRLRGSSGSFTTTVDYELEVVDSSA
jgi:hypothetical protein